MLKSANRRVLLVDDDRAIHRSVARMLPAFELCSAYDGPSALAEIEAALAQRAELALVILDVAMPGWGGLETLERIWEIAPDTQALFCTGAALDRRELERRFGDTDAVLVVNKPFSQIELAQAAQALTTKWRLQRAARAQVSELETAVRARTGELEAASARLAQELAWRDRVETEMRVSQRLEAVGQLAAGIAHEINNPLQYVGDHLEFVTDATGDLLALAERLRGCLERDPGSPAALDAKLALGAIDIPYMSQELPGALDAIRGGLQRITSIVRAMKELSHPGTRDARAADLNRALESALEISASSYRTVADLEKHLTVLPPVTCFVAELGQVFLNLIINAAQAMEGLGPPRGKLVVTSQLDGDHVVISIADTGGGIPPEIQHRIFDPFFTTKDIGRGTGQGLAIARAIVVDRHAGSLSFDSVAGHGTTFVIRIPIAGPAARKAPAAA
ncbi:MAG TPA: ATP-binding protein [Kofleriaceae bacterium]|nr:ATP-binding protein [Kofleriaceae bacterium]